MSGDAVAVVIPTHNHGKFLQRAIESALAQTLEPAEIVVVDDGSTDTTPGVLEQFESRVAVIRQHNRGVSAARNIGAAATRAPLIAFLDADDEWLPHKLEAQVACLRRMPTAGLVHCGYEEVDEFGTVARRCTQGGSGWIAGATLALHPTINVAGSGAMVQRSAFEAVRGFDEAMSASADWDLCLRLALEWPVCFVPEVLLRYRVAASGMHNDLSAVRRDMRRALEKASHRSDVTRQALRVAKARLHRMLAGSYFVQGQHARAVLHGFRAAAASPPEALYILATPLRRRRATR